MTSIRLGMGNLPELQARMEGMSAGELTQVLVSAVNTATQNAYHLTVPHINRGVNLPDNYVRERMRLQLATDSPSASVVATGSKPTMTQLVRYNPQQLFKPTKNGKGLKKGGVSVEVLRGSVKAMQGAFLIELKGGVGQGIATRTGEGRNAYKVRYGPSVYQLFKVAIAEKLDDVERGLTESVVTEVNDYISKHMGDTT